MSIRIFSWAHEWFANLADRWNFPLEKNEAKSLLADGATLVDVRSPREFASGHLPGALNIPLETLAKKQMALPEGPVLLHCKSGLRSNLAAGVLKKRNVSKVYNIGSYQRAKKIVELA